MYKFLLIIFLFLFYQKSTGQTIAFTYTNANGGGLCSPATISFTPVYTGTPIGFTWYFGNGQTSNSAIPSISFVTGSYTVKLVAVFQNIAIETTQTIVVAPSLTVNFTANINNLCKPGNVKFNAICSSPNASYLYNFGDGTTAVTTNSDTITHFYTTYGTFIAKVKVTSASGCIDSAYYEINVKRLELSGLANPTSGCAPLNVFFSVTANLPINVTVTNYNWTFGDNSALQITPNNSVVHTYTDSGLFLPKVLINTSDGCADTFKFQTLTVGIPPVNLVAYPIKLQYCGNEKAKFYGYVPLANSYKWDYGDGTTDVTSDTITLHKYNMLGVKTVKVTPYFNDCPGNSITFTISIIGVIAGYKYSNTCSSKKTFSFTNQSQGNLSSSEWTFGDNSPTVNTSNTFHTFPSNGAFNTQLIVADNITGCKDTIQYSLYTATPILVNQDTFLCRNAPTTFTILNNYVNPSLNSSWSIIGLSIISGSTLSQSLNALYFGNFNNNNVILYNGSQYCNDTIKLDHPISVRGPILFYNASTLGCTNNNFVVINNSYPFAANDTIKNWLWTFGIDGLQNNQYQPTPFQFTAEGTYTIKLIAKDIKGCVDTAISQILVRESPFLRIFPRNDKICFGKTVTLTAYHTDTLVWSPANLVACATCDTTIATPVNNITKIYAIASNAVGCTLKDSTTITVFEPFIATPTANTVFACKNDTLSLEANPKNKKILWSPIEGLSNNYLDKTIATVIKDTITYTALLTDSLGCYSSSTNIKVIAHPSPTVNAGLDRILSYNSTFNITPLYGSSVSNYEWIPAGNLNCTNCPNPSGMADSSRSYTIKTKNSFGCVASDNIKISVECAYANLYMASAFSPNNTNINNYYFPQTRGIKSINSFRIYNRYGELVYEIKNVKPNQRLSGWNGKFRGIPQPTNGYVYTLAATCDLGETINKNGSFLLIR
jgi:gliding motility-associated-like protein